MNDFAAEWLSLREKADLPARDQSVRDIVVKYANGLGKAVIVDLACGTGSMTRSLAGRITVPQKWCLVDNDADLLEEAENHLKERIKPDFEVSTHCVDLNRFPSGIVNLKPNLITTTAFLDLVSVDWLSRLVTFAFMEKVPVYAALTYSGNVEFYPPEPLDGDIVDAMNTHQRGDKGFGPALGPAAADRLTRLFKLSKFETIERASNWNLGDEHKSLQQQYLSGLATAASSSPNLTAQQVGSWLERRQSLVTSGGSRIVVTHKDVAAFPA